MVMPSKEKNHVIPKDREQGETADHWNALLHLPFDSVRVSTHRIRSGSTFMNPLPALFSPPNILPYLPLAPNNLANNYPLETEVAARQLLIDKTEAHEIILAPSPLDPRPRHPCVRHLRHLCARTRLERVTSNCHRQLLHLR